LARRPIAGIFRRTAHKAVGFCLWAGVHPDAISYSSIVVSALAGICFWRSGKHPLLLIAAPLLCYVRLWLNMLDGMVALASGKANKRGEILNDLPDRASDVLIFAGVAHSGLASPISAYWVIIFALLTAYVGIFGQAIGVGRQFAGVMSKPWRMVMLHVGAWVTLGLMWSGRGIRLGGLTALDWTCCLIILGCIQTIWARLRSTLRALHEGNASGWGK